MNPTYAAMFAALAGSLIGGLTSFVTVWFQQHAQHRERRQDSDRQRKETLYGLFITEGSRLYGDALSHEKDDVTDLVGLYAAVNQMRLFSSSTVVDRAEEAIGRIVETYLQPNVPLHAIAQHAAAGSIDPFKAFAEACRDELAAVR